MLYRTFFSTFSKLGNTDIVGEGDPVCKENIAKKELKKHKGKASRIEIVPIHIFADGRIIILILG